VVRGIASAAATDYLTDVLFYPNGAVEARPPLPARLPGGPGAARHAEDVFSAFT